MGLSQKTIFINLLFHKYKVNCQHQANTSGQVIPLEGYPFEEQHGEDNENSQRDHFLHHF